MVVDDFGIKVTGNEHAEHLFAALLERYTIAVAVDYTGSKYVGITIHHDKDARTMSLSTMPGYVSKALTRFGVALFNATYRRITNNQPGFRTLLLHASALF